jgi:predicted ATPase/DNA-binding SARP family transcriptional activator
LHGGCTGGFGSVRLVGNGAPAATSAPELRVDVLGPLRLTVGDQMVEVPGPKRRALLALLATAEGRMVAVDDLLESLWPGEPADTARLTLRSHVSRLRRHLGPCAPLLYGSRAGYRLHRGGAGPTTDAGRARSLLDEARSAEPEVAYTLLDRARCLWRGPPLGEFTDVDRLRALALVLDDLRCTVDEAVAAVAIEVGRPDEAIEIARAHLVDRPWSEPAVLVLMRSLDAAGRSAEALRSGYEHRRALAEQAGLEPSPALSELEQVIAGRAPRRHGQVPRPKGPLHGREPDVAAVEHLLAGERLVTLTGPGGVGKTRLAVEVAGRVEQATALWLGPLSDAAAIPRALAEALGLRVIHGEPLAACVALLGAGPRLVLIDNCEHLLAGVRTVVRELLDTCPTLTVLATSREALGLEVEQRLRLQPLPLTSPRSSDEPASAPAVAVFVDRARRVQPRFSPGRRELPVVQEIVQRLDGMPLAIELAASRLSSLGLDDLRARLDRRLDLLGGGESTTLRQTLEWSYDLLTEAERRLFRHLGFFPHGFDLDAAELVARGIGLPGDGTALLTHLVDSSMIEVGSGHPTRYRMLETMRTFARDRLEAAGELADAADQLLIWAREVLGRIARTVDTVEEARADELLRRELGNLGAAWEAARDGGRIDDAVNMIVTLGEPGGWRELTEVGTWSLELADTTGVGSHPRAASVLGLAAVSAWRRGELERAEGLARRALAGPGEAWRGRAALALVALSRGDLPDAVELATTAASSTTHVDQTLGVAALAAVYQGDVHRAREISARLARVARSPTTAAFHAYVEGEIVARTGQVASAEGHYERAIERSRRSGATFIEGIASVGLLTLRSRAGSVDEALRGYHDLIDYWERTGGWLQQWTTLRNLARLLRSLDDEQTALFLDVASATAPDAPAITDELDEGILDHLPARQAAAIRDRAMCSSRSEVLTVARRAIDRHLSLPRS